MIIKLKEYQEQLPREFAEERCGELDDTADQEEQDEHKEILEEYESDLERIDPDGERENQLREQGYTRGYEVGLKDTDKEVAKYLESEIEDCYEYLLHNRNGIEVLGKGLCEEDKCKADDIYHEIVSLPNNEEYEAGKIAAYRDILNLFNLK